MARPRDRDRRGTDHLRRLAGDVLRTAVAPGFAEIGQLAAIATIRTLLNFFLTWEITEERAEIDQDRKKPEPRFAAP